MIDWTAFASGIDWSAFFNGLIVFVVGILSAVGLRRGLNKKNPSVEIAGGIVDNSAIDRLAAAIEAMLVESVAHRSAREKDTHRIAREMEDLTKELEEMRRALAIQNSRR